MSCSNLFSVAVFLCFLLASSRASSGEKSSKQDCRREKRNVGLFPFPRVGKSFPVTWAFDTDLFLQNMVDPGSEDPQNVTEKRQQLIPFPRVGKSEPKRNGASGGGGLWFGPRLGRVSKRMMELVPVPYRQENNFPENLFKSVLKIPVTQKNLGNANDMDYLEPKQ